MPRRPAPRRFLEDPARRADSFLRGAREYVAAMNDYERRWLRRKPYDDRPGHGEFFLQLYSLMNLVEAMELPSGARVLEVGSGPGWVSEILMLLGHEVDGVEPCEPMIGIARERIALARRHYGLRDGPEARFHAAGIEDCDLPEGAFDAVLFHDALHHVIDEEGALRRCHGFLKPGGVLGVSEDAWKPGDRAQESRLEEEMARFGTLENPFTQAYLDDLLARAGFVEIERYHALNGFVPAEMGAMGVADAAQRRAEATNNLTARKPGAASRTTRDAEAGTRAGIELLESAFDPGDRRLSAKVQLTNAGETRWLHRPRARGWVSLALRTDPLGAQDYREAQPRHRLPRAVLPGESVTLELDFYLPEDPQRQGWRLDLVNEGLFWFSQRGTAPVTVDLRN